MEECRAERGQIPGDFESGIVSNDSRERSSLGGEGGGERILFPSKVSAQLRVACTVGKSL